MPPTTPHSGWEHLLEKLERDLSTTRSELSTRIDRLLPLDVYAADARTTEVRLRELKEHLLFFGNRLEEVEKTVKEELARIREEEEEEMQERKNTIRWTVSSIVIPIIVALILFIQAVLTK